MLKSRLILLPVHQELTTFHMEYIASVVRSLALPAVRLPRRFAK
jgi:hypothetical protein